MEVSIELVIKITLAVTLFNTWVIIEETIIDRHKLWRYLPFYKIGNICVWDFIMAAAIIAFVWSLKII